MKTSLVLGAGGFIGSHMVQRLKDEGHWVRGVDLKYPEFAPSAADDFVIADLRDRSVFQSLLLPGESSRGGTLCFDEIYQFAADMGGAGFVFTGDNDADIMQNSAAINLNLLHSLVKQGESFGSPKIFYSSSACIYPARNQQDPSNPMCSESSAYPADPDSEYGWEKLFSERLYLAYARNYGLNVRIGRFHNIFGPLGTWTGGREKAPAAICRKVAESADGGTVEVWGSGAQTRSFLYIEECLRAVAQLMRSELREPVNIGSEEMVSIDTLVALVAKIAGKRIEIVHVDGPVGVNGRNSDNSLIRSNVGWDNQTSLEDGLRRTYEWICTQVEATRA